MRHRRSRKQALTRRHDAITDRVSDGRTVGLGRLEQRIDAVADALTATSAELRTDVADVRRGLQLLALCMDDSSCRRDPPPPAAFFARWATPSGGLTLILRHSATPLYMTDRSPRSS